MPIQASRLKIELRNERGNVPDSDLSRSLGW